MLPSTVEIAVRVLLERKLGEPGLVGVRPIAEQQHDMVDLELAAAAQADADPGAGLVERRDRALRQDLRHSGRFVLAQPLDQQRLRLRPRSSA